MTLFLLAYLGGALTILSPCILPVLPFVFARSDRPFTRNGLPMLIGLALGFAGVATLATVAGEWAVTANHYGRIAALLLLALFGLTLLWPALAERLMRPVVSVGARLTQTADQRDGMGASLLLGLATGLLWAPCAGPVLGLVLTGAALQGATAKTSLLLFTYALGAVTAMALALLTGGRVLNALKRSLGIGEWIRRGLGLAVLVAVVAILLGLDTGLLTRWSSANTTALEQRLLDVLQPTSKSSDAMMMSGNSMMMQSASTAPMAGQLPVEGELQSLTGAVAWLNSKPLTAASLRGKVVLIDFWTYSCINCLRTLPYVRAWYERYRDSGLVVIGVHTPEFAFEKRLDNIQKALSDYGIRYPVAVDNDYAIWRAFDNHYWPAHYFIDAQGRIRHHHFGEGNYEESEQVIRTLLSEAGQKLPDAVATVNAHGAQAAPQDDVQSPETYIGAARAENFISPEGMVQDQLRTYHYAKPRLNEWSLSGDWVIGQEQALLNTPGGKLVYRFRARDLHLVMGTSSGKAVRFRVRLDGAAPGASAGGDISNDGEGVVKGQRLYQLIRQQSAVGEHEFEIEFLDPGAQVYAFTFG